MLKNVTITGGNEAKEAVMANPQLATSIVEWENELGRFGRILVRPSGTEALIRVMIEAEMDEIANRCAQSLYELINELSR